ncbi:MAG: Crp/Fnr family transcriptional regulator [Janthinobacterium lividum]
MSNYRYKHLANGRRQVVAYLTPGDFCDLHIHVLKAMDHSIATVSACKIVEIPRHRIVEMTERPALARALWWATLVDEGTLREWLLNVGQRPALERIAHLFCEFYVKLCAAGMVTGGSFSLPLTQEDVGDATGLSTVHVNRCLQQLRELGLLKVRRGLVEINDTGGLIQFCGFNPNYLHLDNPKPVT